MHIGVVGAGLAGLVVAFRRAGAGDTVEVFESTDRVGGQLFTERRDGVIVEHGAEGFVASSEVVPRLATDLGAGDALVDQQVARSLAYEGKALRELAPGQAARVLGFQVASRHFGGGLRTLREGMGELATLLASRFSGRGPIHLRAPVRAIEPTGDGGLRIVAERAPQARFDAVVLAVPARSAALLLAKGGGAAAEALRGSAELSSVTATLVYDRGSVGHALDATGFVVPSEGALGGVRACTFTTSKFAGRAPAGLVSLRVFFRPTDDELERLDDEAWIDRAAEALRQSVGAKGSPRGAWVSRWKAALPVFDEPRRLAVAALEEVARGRRIFFAGSSLHGAGIDAAVRSAESCALACSGAERAGGGTEID